MGFFDIPAPKKPTAPAAGGSNPNSGSQPTRTPSRVDRGRGGIWDIKPGVAMAVPPGHMPIGSNSDGLKKIATPAGYSNLLRK
jgi:hypothetical protein